MAKGAVLLLPASAFHFRGSASDRLHAISCLAAAGWYEAGDDPAGQRSVMQVVLNRVRHPAFPSSVCDVVFEGSRLDTGCQFTFTCDGSLARRHPSEAELDRARKLAAEALNGQVDASVGRATHYHADYVTAWWSKKMQLVGMVGLHMFYRWPGRNGSLTGYGNRGIELGFETLASRANSIRGQQTDTVTTVDPVIMSTTVQPSALGTVQGRLVSATEPSKRPSSVVFMAVDPGSLSGSWAIAALSRCTGLRDCQVFAYPSSASAESNQTAPSNMRGRPLFLFLRDRASGMELALWDCTKAPRPSENQCLPNDQNALAGLLRDRSG